MLAVFVDQVKIADYGSIQYVKASEYKVKQSSHQQQKKNEVPNKSPKVGKREESHSHSKKRVSNYQGQGYEGQMMMTNREMS